MREEISDLGLQPDLLPGALRHVPADAGDASRLAGAMESAGRQCDGGCRREGGQGEMWDSEHTEMMFHGCSTGPRIDERMLVDGYVPCDQKKSITGPWNKNNVSRNDGLKMVRALNFAGWFWLGYAALLFLGVLEVVKW